MSAPASECTVFDPVQLLPEAWRDFAQQGPVRTFNPALLRDGAGWLFAYRVVGADGLRRIALCRLDGNLAVVAGSARPLTDQIRFRTGHDYVDLVTRWFADPRLYRLNGRLFIYWNSGWHEPRNAQFVQELAGDSLEPIGCARELVLRSERQKLEKNWTLFETGEGDLHAIYSIAPHRVMRFSLAGDGDILFDEVARTEWSQPSYPENHGGLRGGAPPVRHAGEFWSFCHSVHSAPGGYRYAAAVYRFSASPPFTPTHAPSEPLDLGRPFSATRRHERLNPAVGEVIYPCGAARDGARWLVSHGINDEQCAISLVSDEAIAARLEPARIAPVQPPVSATRVSN